tara:strand:- start:26350 stop:26928 length:579 start_codon:yes stop_codon:yes gene_type:complete
MYATFKEDIMAEKKKNAHYVDNKKLLAAMIEFRNSVIEAKENDKPRPRIPNYIGECIMKISEHLSYRPNFINYTYKDEMISDGIENCLLYIDNFNPEKSKNPFAYFTQIIYYAFIRRMQKEKKQTYVKYKSLERHVLEDDILEAGGVTKKSYLEFMQNNMSGFIEDFEKSQKVKKTRAKAKKKEQNENSPLD